MSHISTSECCNLCYKPLPNSYVDYTTFPRFCDGCKNEAEEQRESKRYQAIKQYLTALTNAMEWMPAGYLNAQQDREAYQLPVEIVIVALMKELDYIDENGMPTKKKQ